MSEVQIYLESLSEAFADSNGSEAKRIVSQIHSLFKADNLTQLEIDSGITSLLKTSQGKQSILDLVKCNFMKANFKEAVGNIFELLSDLLNNYDKKLDIYVEDIISVCLKALRSSCHAEIKLKSHLPLSGVVCNTNWSQYVQRIAELTVDQIVFKKNTPNVLNKQLFLLGTLCEKHPEVMTQHSNRIGASLMNLVCEDISSAKINFTAKEGMFAAVQGYMSMCDLDSVQVDKVYRCIKTFSNPRDSARKGFARGAVKLLSSKPGKVFSEHISADLNYWLQLLIRYVSSTNADDRFEGCLALNRVYEYVGNTLEAKGSCDFSMRILRYLMKYFKEIISNPCSNKELEYKLALEGFAVITSKCRNLIGDEEFVKVTEVLTQRAKLVLRDEDVSAETENDGGETIERMDKICMYINALAVLGSGAKESLLDLTKVLVSEYPECPVTKRNKVTFTLIRNIFLTDVQVLIPFIVKESCRHSIALSLQYTKQLKNNRDKHTWTYENFVDIWEALLTSFKGEDIFNIYIDHVLKIILHLDFTTKSTSNTSNADISSELEEVEIPSHTPEYSFFVNLCDLTSTVVDLFASDVLPSEWCRPWLSRIFAMVVEGLEKNPLATSLLKVSQSALVVARKLCIFNDDDHKDTASQIMDLFKILSINKSSGSHQLRSALFALQAPHQMLNEYILDIASDAFQVVLRNGKNNLDLISKAMDILDDWDSSIDRDSFRPLCVKLLPTLNDYLCSCGISDSKFVEGEHNRSRASRYEFASRRRRVFLTQGTSKQLEAVQHKIMRFIGKMDSDTLQCLLMKSEDSDTNNAGDAEDMEDIQLGDLSEKLKISIPCPEQTKIEIYLDSLVPRIKDLSLNSTNRDTRVTACQALHSLILLMYGTHRTLPQSSKASLANTLYELTSVMLILAADTDTTIRDMFDPLLTESCHWFTSPMNASSVETEKFLLALMKGAYHPSDSQVREKACLALKEVVKWSVKQSSNRELFSGPPSAAAILRSVCQGIVHPDAYRKRGALLIFNNVASQVYHIESLIDKFLPEILYLTVSSINVGHTTLDKQYIIYKLEAMKAVHVVLKCLQSKAVLFKAHNPNRRIPNGFGKCLLKDLALWLLRQSKDCNCRITARRLLKTFTIISVQLDGCSQSNSLINKMIESQGFLSVAQCFLQPESILDASIFRTTRTNYLNTVGILMNHISCVDCHILIHRHEIMTHSVTYTKENIKSLKLFESLKYLLSLDHGEIVSSFRKTELMPFQIETIENLLFQVYWKVYELLINVQKASVTKVLDLYVDGMCSCIVFWLFDYDLWTILNRNLASEDMFSVKRMIADMKQDFNNEKWQLFVAKCETFKKNKLVQIFENFNDVSVMTNSVTKFLEDFVDLFNIIKSKRLCSDLRHVDVLTVFQEFFSSCISLKSNEAELRKPVISFILNCDLLQLSDILEILLKVSNDSTHITDFLKVYQDQLSGYFIDHYVDLLLQLKDQHDCNMAIVSMILKYLAEKKCRDGEFIRYLTNWIIQVWPKLSETNNFDALLEYFTLLIIALPAQDNLYSAHTMRHWLLQELQDPDRSMDKKTKLIYLLPAVCKPSDDTIIESELAQALNSMTCHFPQRSNEFPIGTPERERYLSAYRALLETMANSGNFAVFKAVVNTSCVDKDHVCDKQIAHKIVSLMERLSPHQSFIMLDWVYAAFLSKSYDPSIKLNLLNRFLVPMLKAASVDALEIFYGEHILGVIGKLDKEVNTVICGEIPLKHLFVEWNASFLLAEVMFSKIPDNVLESPESKIGCHNKKWKSHFSRKCIEIRNVSVPSCDNQIHVMEYLRLSRCSAYKCLYCIVVSSGDGSDGSNMIRRYELLLNNPRFPLLWEGMIDPDKQYVFPLDQTCKLKHHTVRSKKSSNSESVTFLLNQNTLSQSFMGGVLQTDEEKRKMVFSQTLQDDILKYDFNMATTRDPCAVIIPNIQNQVVLELEDTDLLNHEVLATVCYIMRDMDRITSPPADQQDVQIAPSWVQHLAAVLGDRRRPNNVKLFLSQVMVKLRENGSDVFKKYSRLCLRPLLSVVHDRCTTSVPGDNNLNFWDIGILLMLLSWRENAIPSTQEEINSANFILEILIKQTNPNTQSPELFKHSLELLKDLLNIWGLFLKIPSDVVITKLQSVGDKLLTAGIQIAGVILACGCRPWDEDEQFDVITKILIKLLSSSESKIYKSSAEVIGLMLKLLYMNSASNDESDVDMDSKDYSKYISFRDTVRSKLKDFKSNKSKFIPCLYMTRKYHAEICDESLVDFIVYLIPKLPIHTKKMCFRIVLSAIDFMDATWLRHALINMEIKSYMKDKDLGIICLHIVNKLLDKVDSNCLMCFMEDICSLGNHKETDVREVAYEILMKAYNIVSEKIASSVHNLNDTDDKTFIDFTMSSTSGESRKRPFESTRLEETASNGNESVDECVKYNHSLIKAALLLGMEDEEEHLRKRLCNFWTEKLQNNLQDRWLHTISQLYVDKESLNQGCEMERAVRLVLEACKKAPDYETTKLFDGPLENCDFLDYSLDGRRPKQSSLLAPMFAETINSNLQLSSLAQSLQNGDIKRAELIASQMHSKLSSFNTTLLNQEQQLLRSTLDSVSLGFSIDSMGRSLSSGNASRRSTASEGFSLQDESSLLFTVEPQLVHRRTYQPLSINKQEDSENETLLTSEGMLRRRLITNKNMQKAKFAAIAMEKNIRKEQMRLSEKPAPIFRSFRKGDYPDVQIKLDNVVAPMLGLASRDPIFSKDLFIVLFKSLLSHCSREAMDSFKESTAQCVVSRLKTRGIPLTVEALLEVCRICLKSGTEEINSLIRTVAKNNGVEWLGQLVLDELTADDKNTANKRIKLEEGVDHVVSLPADMRSEIRSLKWFNQWDELQIIYQNATLNPNLGNMEKLHCTEEYFNCFARLSDWTGFMDGLKDHLTPDSLLEDDSCVDGLFDMNLLWSTKHRTETYLHLVFMAHIQMRASVDYVYNFKKLNDKEKKQFRKDIRTFTDNLNIWMGEPDKNSVLEGRMIPYVSLWKAANSDHSVEGCDEALKWLRQEWTRECSGATQAGLQDTLDVIQIISETRNYLDLVSKMSSSRTNEEVISRTLESTQYSWQQCVPRPYNDTVSWDLRLACRSIYTCQLQNFIKSEFDSVDEDEKLQYRVAFSKIQRRAELCLVKTALHQRNYHLAKKLLEKHAGCVNDVDEALPWQLEEMRLEELAADRETDLQKKLSCIVKSWSKGESVRKSLPSTTDAEYCVGLLGVSSNMADMLCSTVSRHLWEDCVSHLASHRGYLETLLLNSSIVLDKETLLAKLIDYSSSLLMECVEIVEGDSYVTRDNNCTRLSIKGIEERKMLKCKAETYMKMVRYARKAKEEYLNDVSHEGLLKLTISGILNSMRYGHMEARILFPVLLLELEDLPEGHHLKKLFMEEVSSVPCWMFISWAAQLLAHLPTQCLTLLPLLTRMAREYPSALRHHYQLSKDMWGHLPHMKEAVERLDQLLFDVNVSALVRALGSLRCPWTSLKAYVEERLRDENCDRSKVLDELREDLLCKDEGETGGKIRGQVFSEIRSCIDKLEVLRTTDNGPDVQNVLVEVLKACSAGQSESRDRSRLDQFSPYLDKYRKSVSDAGMEVFGQYDGFQSSPPDPENHVTIVKFHPEVSIFKSSNRRPMRVSLYGSNGKKYSFLVKCSEDLRQDNRIQQVLDLMNHPLNQISMHIAMYKVFPITQSLGVIEYVKGCSTLHNIICHAGSHVQGMMIGACGSRKKYIEQLEGTTIIDKYGTLTARERMPLNAAQYREKVKSIPGNFLRNSLQKIAGTSEMFVKMKTNFIRTLAPMSIAHWILGIGDRHLSNCMVNLNTGGLLGIDFGHALGTATQQLSIPELMPFRLTPQIRGVIGRNDDLSELMWQSLSKLCEQRCLLLAAMEVFVREPTLNWIKDDSQRQWRPRHKIDQCKRKLNGIDPITIVIEDLQSRTSAEKYTLNFCQIVRNVGREQKHLTVDQQVDRLINLATDDGIMSVTYYGWNPYF